MYVVRLLVKLYLIGMVVFVLNNVFGAVPRMFMEFDLTNDVYLHIGTLIVLGVYSFHVVFNYIKRAIS